MTNKKHSTSQEIGTTMKEPILALPAMKAEEVDEVLADYEEIFGNSSDDTIVANK